MKAIHLLIRTIVIGILTICAILLLLSCSDNEVKPEPVLKRYSELMLVFDRVGRNKPITLTPYGDMYVIEFWTGERYRITQSCKSMICSAMPHLCL